MDIRATFIGSIVTNGQATVRHADSEDNEDDGFTKSLNTIKFEKFWKHDLSLPSPP